MLTRKNYTYCERKRARSKISNLATALYDKLLEISMRWCRVFGKINASNRGEQRRLIKCRIACQKCTSTQLINTKNTSLNQCTTDTSKICQNIYNVCRDFLSFQYTNNVRCLVQSMSDVDIASTMHAELWGSCR
jgi:hypothetical protein